MIIGRRGLCARSATYLSCFCRSSTAPNFAYQPNQFSLALFFVMPVLFALILVGLANIQDELENPFDQIGVDDVAIDPERFASLDLGLTSADGPLGREDGETTLDHSHIQAQETAVRR